MKIAEFEKKVGLSRDTLRYYEKIGVLTPPHREENGYRQYGKVQLEELAFIQKGKAIGFDLSTICEGYRRFKVEGRLCPEFVKQLQDKKAMFNTRISEANQAITEIDSMLNTLK